MSIYAIGDVQGCFGDLQRLLAQLSFRPQADRLWFVGDLVNRGPQSLDVLRFVRDLGDGALTVLGNHDLHLLAAAAGVRRIGPKDTFTDVLEAPDRDELLDWLRSRPLMHFDPERDLALIHAGLAPEWDIEAALARAAEVEAVLRSPGRDAFFRQMYGDRPDRWSDGLAGADRLRLILNCFTRLRLCDREGRLHFAAKGTAYGRGDGLIPWFDAPGRKSAAVTVVFGHWSMLGRYQAPGLYALDSGCVWGGALTALRLDANTPEWHGVSCPAYCEPGQD
jgi:bis(5'-nucleosyl)-tetraphosphatase (symmetrical)